MLNDFLCSFGMPAKEMPYRRSLPTEHFPRPGGMIDGSLKVETCLVQLVGVDFSIGIDSFFHNNGSGKWLHLKGLFSGAMFVSGSAYVPHIWRMF